MIEFIECPKVQGEHAYNTRTKQNILYSDVTIAMAINFQTRGEVLTKSFCQQQAKIYVPISLKNMDMPFERMMKIVCYIDRQLYITQKSRNIRLNIAGNGIYGLPLEQAYYDEYMAYFIEELTGRGNSLFQVIFGCTGGQTGMDEAGAKGMDKNKLSVVIRAPHGWAFRDRDKKDIKDEQLFKQRFI